LERFRFWRTGLYIGDKFAPSQHNGPNQGNEQQHRGEFKGQEIIREKVLANFNNGHIADGGFCGKCPGRIQHRGLPAGRIDQRKLRQLQLCLTRLASLGKRLALIHQHNPEQNQHVDSADINQHLGCRQETAFSRMYIPAMLMKTPPSKNAE
jgi:hypothetical protein